MTRLFINLRRIAHAFVFVFTLVTLGMAATLASNLLSSSNTPHSFIIFTLIVTAATILGLILLTSYSQPRTELVVLFILGVGWVATGAWATDIIGHIQCEMISKSDRIQTKTGSMSSRMYCYEVKTIEAFAWTNFALFTMFFLILISLATRAHSLGRPDIWSEPIAELPWYGQYPGYESAESEEGGSRPGSRYDPRLGPYGGMYGQQQAFYPMMAQPSAVGQTVVGQPAGQGYQVPQGGYVVQQQPGHSVVIQPGQNGQATVSQVPTQLTQRM